MMVVLKGLNGALVAGVATKELLLDNAQLSGKFSLGNPAAAIGEIVC